MKYGAKKKIIVSNTSPANTLPNSLKDKEIILAISDTNSNMPIKNEIGFLLRTQEIATFGFFFILE